jgi:hypothetical protein
MVAHWLTLFDVEVARRRRRCTHRCVAPHTDVHAGVGDEALGGRQLHAQVPLWAGDAAHGCRRDGYHLP